MNLSVTKDQAKGRGSKLFGAGAAVALSVAALTVGAASPALAESAPSTQGCTQYANLDGGVGQARVDNCPGTGLSWAWLYLQSGAKYSTLDMYAHLADGSTKIIEFGPGQSYAANWNSRINSANVCGEYWGTKYEYGQWILWLYTVCTGEKNF
ncbi:MULTISPECIES: hypothetical protein [unclassified Streptomyces]|uniref:hypothetical protein n=1 Tax=unclassified Streptomyces TaxID=2593676 RepID=UPI001319DDD6|nr:MULTISPECIES: hypothetical protein [unclassified Streptomyces]MYX35021.1 hypothetical protein [Streptomyces sp. SID8377]